MFPEWAKEILKNSNEDSTDFLYGENTHLEIMIMKSFAETKHGMSLTDACKKYGISIKEFKENFSSVFPGSSFEKDFPNY